MSKIENEIFILYKIPIFKVVNVTRNFLSILRTISYKKVLNVKHNFNFSLLSVFLGRLRSICVKIEKLTSNALECLINVKVAIIMCTGMVFQLVYRTCAIINLGLYISYPIFHFGLYCRTTSVTDNSYTSIFEAKIHSL